MADNIAKNGVYVDTQTGKVVRKEPEQGIQLVAPGGEITDAVQAAIDRYEDDTVVATATAPDDTEKTVTTKSRKKG
jgi:hypothetical protein